ncbi:MAG: glycosyltransferase family 1 protein [Pseudobutyrivibrio ruminis]|nr:glycosyltransferase family 1 protein [Pseudobutyrivibrio ruminis]
MTDYKRPIRVAHVIGKLNAAGVEAVINNYYRNIDRNKYQFDFFIDSDGECQPPKYLIELGARYFVIPPYQHIFKHVRTLIRLFKENKYLIVHSSMNTLSPISLFCAWFAGVPVRINHNHSTAGKGEFKKSCLKYALRPFSKCFATHFAACSRFAGEWLFGRKMIQSGRVKIFNNAIDVDKFKYSESIRKAIRKALGVEGMFVIGHVGRFCYQKNHDFLIDVFKSVHDVEEKSVLLLVGTGKLKEQIENKVSDLDLKKNVLFLGVRQDVDKLYQAMDVFVLPSHYEGLPVVGIEAQASGLPCFFSDRFTEESVIDSNTRVLKLDASAVVWRDEILRARERSRKDCSNSVRRSGFDIVKEAKVLEDYYDMMIASLN